MTWIKKIIFISVLGLLLAGPALGEETGDEYQTFVDIVSEVDDNGTMIQLGDFTITKIKSLWLDEGQRDGQGNPVLFRVPRRYIKVGQPARVFLEQKDENGFWIAHRLIVFSGKGLEEAITMLPSHKRRELKEGSRE
ncbi:MAG: hypothetical protein HUN04_15155 [Desulfobacter sp.]|nr:MAG: hypothetical protein HUN04_15155 [Desulfobacter sp.]